MLPDNIVESLNTGSEEDAKIALDFLQNYTIENSEEAQIITNLLVPYLKNEKTKNQAYQIFKFFHSKFKEIEYPRELLNSNLQLKTRYKEYKKHGQNEKCVNSESKPSIGILLKYFWRIPPYYLLASVIFFSLFFSSIQTPVLKEMWMSFQK